MSLIQDFVSYFKNLDQGRQSEVETLLSNIMGDDESSYHLTPNQEDEIRALLNDPNRVMASEKDVNAVFTRHGLNR